MLAAYKIKYKIENDSVFDATITSAIVSSKVSGPSTDYAPDIISVDLFETVLILEEKETINLVDVTDQQAYVSGLRIQCGTATE